ncbi:SMC-Scp complex subunit ScpB [Kribbella speibonae]|uniref:SMC-Scp complex subunit ScpB n=2 Tax=Kribbella speibonae TaxID=1572660 RepID=A0A4R0INJ5_9ACTN|nr:SMC-Scp complex subunit ScpB [Kribbella speibonae]
MRRALEAILMVTDEPLPVLTMARAVGRPTGDVAGALEELAAEYTEQGRGFDLREVGGGWRYYTRVEAAPYVERFVLDGQQARLTQAALETLAVVAYKQPVSRARVSAIRGVNVDGVMRTLVARGLVEEAGSDTESQATLYRTTTYFLERMGMQSLDDLPELAPYLPDMDDIEDELAAQTLPPTSDPEPETKAAEDAEHETDEEATTPATSSSSAKGGDALDAEDGAGEDAAVPATDSSSAEGEDAQDAKDEVSEEAAAPVSSSSSVVGGDALNAEDGVGEDAAVPAIDSSTAEGEDGAGADAGAAAVNSSVGEGEVGDDDSADEDFGDSEDGDSEDGDSEDVDVEAGVRDGG